MNSKIIKSCMALAIAVIMLTATVFADNIENGVDWDKGVVRATGLAAGKSTTKNKGLRRAQAKRAATMDAQRNLAENVEGVRVTSESSMKDLELEYDIVRTRVDTVIKGMTEVSEKFYDDETCEVVLEMPIFGASKSLAQAAFEPFRTEPKEPFPQPTTNININTNINTVVKGVVSNQYTGLIIDCSGMGLEAVMSPVIKNNNGQPIYGYKNLDIDKVIAMGMASYAENANDSISRERAGNNPIVVKAVKLEGFNANPVVSVADSDKILIANQTDMFLENCAVVFVK